MKQYVVDAFTDTVFGGNPAAVCLLDAFPEDQWMQKIAQENHLSETAFLVKKEGDYDLRWFTPGGEIDLCGHATLAAAYVIMEWIEKGRKEVLFHTRSGPLTVQQNGSLYEMDFPSYTLRQVLVTQQMVDALGARPQEAWMGRDLLCVFASEEEIRGLKPDLQLVKQLDGLLLQTTAPGSKTDCVSRTFAPKMDVPEDPVCGSGHCHIVPYWANRLQKQEILAYQASSRGGVLYGKYQKDRVTLSGKVALYSIAELFLPW